MDIEIVYEDESTIVVNKPVGAVVNRADSVHGETIQAWFESNYQDCFKGVTDRTYLMRSGVCHRLDKETSGCLMIAKTPDALKYYLRLFKDRKIKKTYSALVHGRVEPVEGDIVLPLKRSIFDREKWRVYYDGKKAFTSWKVVQRFSYPGHEQWKNSLTLLKVNLKTGRTHQIRVHMSFLGWPIFSDEKYMNNKLALEDRKQLSHHFLHAENLKFVNIFGEKTSVTAKLPNDADRFLKTLMLE